MANANNTSLDVGIVVGESMPRCVPMTPVFVKAYPVLVEDAIVANDVNPHEEFNVFRQHCRRAGKLVHVPSVEVVWVEIPFGDALAVSHID